MREPTDKKQTLSFCNSTLFGEERLSFDVPSPLPTIHKVSWSVVGSTLSMIEKKTQQQEEEKQQNNNDNSGNNQQQQKKQWSTFFLKRV